MNTNTSKDILSFNWASDFLPGPACYVDKNLSYEFMNKKYRSMFKIEESEEIKGLKVENLLGKQYSDIKKHIDNVFKGHEVTYEADLGFKILQVHYIPDHIIKDDKTSEVIGFFMMGLDVTELRNTQSSYKKDLEKEVKDKTKDLSKTLDSLTLTKKEVENKNKELKQSLATLKFTQNQLVESEKIASLGCLVSGMAHELNTPLGIGIVGITHFLGITKDIEEKYNSKNMSQEEFESYLEDSKKLATQINKNLEKTALLVRSFKQISKEDTQTEKIKFELIQYLKDVIKSLNTIIKNKNKNLIISVNSNSSIYLNSYPEVYSKIITNLILNSVRHGFEENEKGHILINITKEKENLKIIYKDDGKGIPKENISKIFDPFFTTNRQDGGIGLGLNVVYNTVTANLNGNITCSSEEQEGVYFNKLYIITPDFFRSNNTY